MLIESWERHFLVVSSAGFTRAVVLVSDQTLQPVDASSESPPPPGLAFAPLWRLLVRQWRTLELHQRAPNQQSLQQHHQEKAGGAGTAAATVLAATKDRSSSSEWCACGGHEQNQQQQERAAALERGSSGALTLLHTATQPRSQEAVHRGPINEPRHTDRAALSFQKRGFSSGASSPSATCAQARHPRPDNSTLLALGWSELKPSDSRTSIFLLVKLNS